MNPLVSIYLGGVVATWGLFLTRAVFGSKPRKEDPFVVSLAALCWPVVTLLAVTGGLSLWSRGEL